MTTKIENFVRHLLSLNMSDADIAALASVPASAVAQVRAGQRPTREYLAPTYGAAFASTPDPTTAFERALKAAGKFATVAECMTTVETLAGLLDFARRRGDVAGEFAVNSRASQLFYRARGCRRDKPAQLEMLRQFIAYSIALP